MESLSLNKILKISDTNSKTGKRPWRKEESSLVLEKCHLHIRNGTLPGKIECEALLKNPCLMGRKWTGIKDFVRNHSKKMKNILEK